VPGFPHIGEVQDLSQTGRLATLKSAALKSNPDSFKIDTCELGDARALHTLIAGVKPDQTAMKVTHSVVAKPSVKRGNGLETYFAGILASFITICGSLNVRQAHRNAPILSAVPRFESLFISRMLKILRLCIQTMGGATTFAC
jgi:hypothetical protein